MKFFNACKEFLRRGDTVWLNLFPQVVDHVDNAQMIAVAVHVPERFKNLCPCKHPDGTGSKEYKDIFMLLAFLVI